MSQLPYALWLTVSPYLKKFDQRLLCHLSKRISVSRWEYMQSVDEPCCLENAISLLHEYLAGYYGHRRQQVHLVGHGLSGIVGWLYTQRHPEHVKSLTLLSVGANPAVNWHAHYYALRQLLPCSREIVLAQMVRLLFGDRGCDITRALVRLLAQDLDSGLALHSLAEAERNKCLATMEVSNATPIDRSKLDQELKQILADGYAVNLGDNEPDIAAVSVPVFGHAGRVVLTLSVFGMLSRFDSSFVERARNELCAVAAQVSEHLD